MLDCGLDLSPVLNFMPIPLVHSTKLSQLTRVTSKEKQLDGVRNSYLNSNMYAHTNLLLIETDNFFVSFGTSSFSEFQFFQTFT